MRAAKGASFSLPLWTADWAGLQQLQARGHVSRLARARVTCVLASVDFERAAPGVQREHGMRLLAADPAAPVGLAQEAVAASAAGARPPPWLVLGSEGQGLSPAARQLCSLVHIPGADGVESLNVAAAGAILIYALSSRH